MWKHLQFSGIPENILTRVRLWHLPEEAEQNRSQTDLLNKYFKSLNYNVNRLNYNVNSLNYNVNSLI
jgi:hypothetical protein